MNFIMTTKYSILKKHYEQNLQYDKLGKTKTYIFTSWSLDDKGFTPNEDTCGVPISSAPPWETLQRAGIIPQPVYCSLNANTRTLSLVPTEYSLYCNNCICKFSGVQVHVQI